MTTAELSGHLAAYAAGLEAELALLRQIEALSTSQEQASTRHDIAFLHSVMEDRERLVAALLQVESQLKPLRQTIADHRRAASALPGFGAVADLHRHAGEIVGRVMSSDRGTLAALQEAESARRSASQAIEAGEHTLAAYRRALFPTVPGPSLVDRRG